MNLIGLINASAEAELNREMLKYAVIGIILGAIAITIAYGIQRYVDKKRRFRTLPKKGQRFRNRRKMKVMGLIYFRAAFTGGFKGVLPAGETFILVYEPHLTAHGVSLTPERYQYFEQVFVDADSRQNAKYAGYSISISSKKLQRDFDWLAAEEEVART